MSRLDDIKEVEYSIQQAKTAVELGLCLTKLQNNRDFRKLILEYYFEQESIRLVHAKSDTALQSDFAQAIILKQMDSIGSLKHFFDRIQNTAAIAYKTIESDEATRDELLEEGLQ